ncbi:hypothetical protein [Nitrososphaera viennensis]|uniref:Roadblock/LAMTOR2 domain-containing protein n=2 Tax=Nitrososphaera viennensis TaxID=1034015 RepID=A0A060HCI9_9ARCH|nr:hypothetical protein [Nitrososphaera viennensis]AIC14434.1 hypothetical protein NVIE_002480 [Nitrososphaera viennensis EN76]UVS69414.1 hypothetical protein NWT39_01180 [Nitrososphaera viennensis]
MLADTLLKEIMDANEHVVAALFIEDGQLTIWRGRDDVALPPENKVKDLLFQRLLINALLSAKKEYTGKLHFDLTRYDLIDMVHFGWVRAEKEVILLIIMLKSTNVLAEIEKFQTLISQWKSLSDV